MRSKTTLVQCPVDRGSALHHQRAGRRRAPHDPHMRAAARPSTGRATASACPTKPITSRARPRPGQRHALFISTTTKQPDIARRRVREECQRRHLRAGVDPSSGSPVSRPTRNRLCFGPTRSARPSPDPQRSPSCAVTRVPRVRLVPPPLAAGFQTRTSSSGSRAATRPSFGP